MRVDILETPDLGDRSYVISDGTIAVVIDPQRDLDRVEALISELGLPVTHVLETHVHNDYVTGGHALARRTGAAYVMNGADDLAFDHHAVSDGDVLETGSLTVRVVATPGHTDTHLSYVVEDGDGPPRVFSGGSLLFGSVGRTDLLGDERTDELTRAQYRSARRLSDLLPDDAPLFPTHGFGSFCSSGGAAGGSDSTMGAERARNDALTEPDEQAFVDLLVAGLTGYPSYYVHMGPLNRQGPAEADLSAPAPVDAQTLRERLTEGQWVIDLRDRRAYAGHHLAGTVSIGMGDQFSTYVGWLVPWGAPLTLLGETPEQVADAQRSLARIGIDELAGAADGGLEPFGPLPVSDYEVSDFASLAAEPGAQVLDVRRHDERRDGGLEGSAHIPLDELVERLDEVPAGPVWVHCASGYRASIAASILDRAGKQVVHVDDDFAAAEKAGLTVV